MSTAYTILNTMREQAMALQGQGMGAALPIASSRGLGFVVNGQRFFCSGDLVREVSVCGDLIPIPQTKAWLRGVVNSKGVLFSVVDLAMLAGSSRPTTTLRGQGHLMILRHETRQCALLVSRVIGFRAFDFSNAGVRSEAVDETWDGLSAFMGKTIDEGDQSWVYLDIDRLIDSEVFLEVQ